jgi:hypothetical protein
MTDIDCPKEWDNWPAKYIDDLLMQESCCCGCKISFPRLFFQNIDRSGNNISSHYLSSYHFCSVKNKRLAAAFCSLKKRPVNSPYAKVVQVKRVIQTKGRINNIIT